MSSTFLPYLDGGIYQIQIQSHVILSSSVVCATLGLCVTEVHFAIYFFSQTPREGSEGPLGLEFNILYFHLFKELSSEYYNIKI